MLAPEYLLGPGVPAGPAKADEQAKTNARDKIKVSTYIVLSLQI
jgi:hypothetical protein